MNKYFKYVLISVPLLLASGLAMAQPATNIDTIQVAPNGNGDVSLNYLGDGTVTQITLRINFDNTNLTPDLSLCGGMAATVGPGSVSCINPSGSPNEIRISLFNGSTMPISDGTFGSVNFTDTSGSPNTFPLTFIDESYSDAAANSVTPVGSTEGAVQVTAPSGSGFYASTPAPGEDLDFGNAVVGDTTAPVVNLNVQNLSPDTPFDITAFSGPAVLTFPVVPITIAAGANANQNINCSPTAVGDNGGTFMVTHDSMGGATSPVSYNFICIGLAPNVQVMPTSVTLTGTIGGTPPTGSFTVTNPQTLGNTASDAQNATLTVTTDATEITITDNIDDNVITVGETDTVTFSCSTAAAGGPFTETVQIAWDDPVGGGQAMQDVTVTCNIANVSPSFASTPAAPGPIAFGPVTNGTTSDPMGIDVSNDGVGASPGSDLTITTAMTGTTDFAATVNFAGPFVLGDDTVADAITVTCSPPAGSTTTLTDTLTVTHNGDDSPTVFNLTCDPVTDAGISSTPPDGGTLSIVTPPGTNADRPIVISNTGTTDNLTLDTCFLSMVTNPEITLVTTSFGTTIAPGDSTDVVVNCAPPAPGQFTGLLTCDVSDIGGNTTSLMFDLRCTGQILEVPTMTKAGLLAMIMALLAVGFIGFRLRQN